MTNQTLPRFSADNGLRFRTLGDSGLFVSELCLGTMTFGGDKDIWGLIGQVQQDEADELSYVLHWRSNLQFVAASCYF